MPIPSSLPKHSSAARLRPLGASAALGAALLLAAGLLHLHPVVPSARTLAAYATDLSQRTPHQRFNAQRAAAALDGVTIGPGKVFSFNRAVRGWSADQGFLKAPVSYDGVLVDDYGGGVCETSTTVYNVALRAGLPILERHAHTFAPGYAPPGRDAAVAYAGVDLRFRNPYSQTLTLRVRPEGHRLVCRIEASQPLGGDGARVVVRTETLDRFTAVPAPVRPGAGARRSRWHPLGRDGVRVAVYRDFYEGDRCVRRESVSDDTYRPISRAEWTMP